MSSYTTCSVEPRNQRFLALDAWRGICACLVALFHFGSTSHIQNLPLLRNAYLFVDFFSVLSGFVIFASYEEKLKDGFGAGRFLLLRLGRLYPLHLVLLLAFMGADLLKLIPALGGYSAYRPFATSSWQGDLLSVIYLAVLIAISYVTYHAIEAPCRQWFKAAVRTRRQVVQPDGEERLQAGTAAQVS